MFILTSCNLISDERTVVLLSLLLMIISSVNLKQKKKTYEYSFGTVTDKCGYIYRLNIYVTMMREIEIRVDVKGEDILSFWL